MAFNTEKLSHIVSLVAESTFVIARVAAVTAQPGDILSKEFLDQFHAMRKMGTLIEGIEGKLLNERRDAVNHDVV